MRFKRWNYPKRSTNGANVAITTYLSESNMLLLSKLAQQAQTSPQQYLNELVDVALMMKRESKGQLNLMQRLQTESATCSSGLRGFEL